MAEKRNICLLNDSFPPAIDGVANAVSNYAEIIQKKYGSASVVTPYYPDADDSALPFQVLRYPSFDMTKLVGYRAGFPLSPDLMKKVENGKFDLIHSHCPIVSTMLARILRDRIHVPLVFTYHTKFDIDIAHAIRGKFMQEAAIKILAENISACDEVWTVSRGAGENMRSLGYEGDYIVMPNGVDFEAGRISKEQIKEVCQGFDLPDGIPMFLFVGRMMWYKGLRIILDALKNMKDSGYDFRMVFVGKGMDGPEIEKYCQKLNLGDKVFFSPPVYDRNAIRAWYCRADLFLFPSTFDTNGLVVREAAACGLASVLISGSCAAEDIIDGRNGFFIEENAESMAALLKQLYGKKDIMREVGKNAQNEIYISWDSAVKNACERYEIVLDNYKKKIYQPHVALTDGLFRGAAEAMAAINTMRIRRQAIVDSVNENFRDIRTDMQEGRERVYGKLDELWQRIDRFL